MLASVTTTACRRIYATKKPLNAPTRPPIASPVNTIAIWDKNESPDWLASVTLTRESVAPADRSIPASKNTIVSPIAASARAAVLVESELNSK